MKTVLCHGVFDGLHIGHIRHLEAAKALGDQLIVSVTADEYVNKGPGRPVFALKDRLDALRALRCVDEVWSSPYHTAAKNIDFIRPNVFAKGTDYRTEGIIPEEKAACEKVGAEIVYLGEKLGSSSALYRNEDPFLEHCRQRWSPADFRDAIEGFSSLKVGVIGDAILDEYIYVEPQGLTSKSRTLNVRQVSNKLRMSGGALAVHNHVVALGAPAQWLGLTARSVKTRYVVKGPPPQKLFGVDALTPDLSAMQERSLTAGLIDSDADVTIVADFGHGCMSDAVRECVQSRALFLALNCQTNSANFGFNTITDRYHRADMFAVDKTELALAVGEHEPTPSDLRSLRMTLKAQTGFATFGGTNTYCETGERFECPALEPNPIDTMGAGDAFFAAAALASAKRYDPDLCLLIGQLAGALHTKIVGNSELITKAALIKAGMALLAR